MRALILTPKPLAPQSAPALHDSAAAARPSQPRAESPTLVRVINQARRPETPYRSPLSSPPIAVSRSHLSSGVRGSPSLHRAARRRPGRAAAARDRHSGDALEPAGLLHEAGGALRRAQHADSAGVVGAARPTGRAAAAPRGRGGGGRAAAGPARGSSPPPPAGHVPDMSVACPVGPARGGLCRPRAAVEHAERRDRCCDERIGIVITAEYCTLRRYCITVLLPSSAAFERFCLTCHLSRA